MTFALRVKSLREEKQLSQAKLAFALGVGVGSVGMWESTQEIPPAKKLVKIADFFDVSLDYLVGRSDSKNALVRTQHVPFSSVEERLIENFRRLPAQSQEYVFGIVQNLAAHS